MRENIAIPVDQRPTISVVVPTFKRADFLTKCLDHFTPGLQTVAEDVYEVIVSDDSPNAQTRQTLSSCHGWAKHVQGPGRGPAANRNNGARFATGEWLLFCDDDCLPDSNLLRSYAEAQKAYPKCNVFEGQTVADREKRHPLEEAPINTKGGNLWSCNFAIRRTLFDEIGGFDESFPFAAVEDMEFRVRLQKSGEQIVFLPEAVVVHPWRKLSARGYLRQQARHQSSHLILIKKHPEFRRVFTTWNVLKDIIRHFVRQFPDDLLLCGATAVLYEPLFLWCQAQRILTYRFGSAPETATQ